ncbi:MAG: hypothetical protein R3B84_17665 [Zavarzinella sp.]
MKKIIPIICLSSIVLLSACDKQKNPSGSGSSGTMFMSVDSSGKPIPPKQRPDNTVYPFSAGMNNDPAVLMKLQGKWILESAYEGKTKVNQPASFWEFSESKLDITMFGHSINKHDIAIDTTSAPYKMELRYRTEPISKSIFQLEVDDLKMAISPPDHDYPTALNIHSASGAYVELKRYSHPMWSDKDKEVLKKLQGAWQAIPAPGSDIKRQVTWTFSDRQVVLNYDGKLIEKMTIDDLDSRYNLLTTTKENRFGSNFTEIMAFEVSDSELRFFGREGKVVLNFKRIADKN